MATGATRQALPTVTGFAVKCAIATLRRCGADREPLLRGAGLTERDLNEPRHRVSAAAQADFLEYAAIALDDPLFGLCLAEQSNSREAGLMFYALSAAEDVAEALSLLMHYCRIINESVRLKLVPEPAPFGAPLWAGLFFDGREKRRVSPPIPNGPAGPLCAPRDFRPLAR